MVRKTTATEPARARSYRERLPASLQGSSIAAGLLVSLRQSPPDMDANSFVVINAHANAKSNLSVCGLMRDTLGTLTAAAEANGSRTASGICSFIDILLKSLFILYNPLAAATAAG